MVSPGTLPYSWDHHVKECALKWCRKTQLLSDHSSMNLRTLSRTSLNLSVLIQKKIYFINFNYIRKTIECLLGIQKMRQLMVIKIKVIQNISVN